MARTPIANLKGPTGATGPRGPAGVNGTPADEAVGGYIDMPDTESGKAARRVALEVLYAQNPVALTAWAGAGRNRENKAARAVVIGDSVVEGRGASTIPGTRWVDVFVNNLRLSHPVSGIGTGGGVGYLPLYRVPPSTASPWVITGAPALSVAYGLGLRALAFSAAGMKATATITGTSVDVLFAKGTGTRRAYYKVDGGAAVVFDTGGGSSVTDNGILRVALGASGPHTLEVGFSSDSASFLEGVIVYNGDEAKGTHVLEAGHSQYHTDEYDSTDGLNHVTRVQSLAPDLVVFALGENDYLHGHTSSLFKSHLASIISKYRTALPKASLMIVMNFEANAQGFNIEPWSAFVTAAAEIAAADTSGPFGRSGVAFLDLSAVMPRVVDDPSLYADDYHPNDKGGQEYAFYVDRVTG